jgi:hypothetical protein
MLLKITALGGDDMNNLGIDIATRDVNRMVKRLDALKTTACVEGNGRYQQDPNISQVLINTSWSEDELDDWLYKVNHKCDYYGVFTL